MDKIICLRCGTENNDDYKFCINCGASLPKKYNTHFEEKVNAEESRPSDTTEPLDFDGVSFQEMSAYVGKNSEKILSKMSNMQKFNQKVSFCFPVFILGLLLGFFGISIWFFYRKMKKAGVIFLLLGLFITLGDLIVNLGATTQLLDGFIKEFMLGSGVSYNFPALAFEKLLQEYNASYIGIFSFINEYVGGMICPVLAGMFGLHFYKKQAISDIKKIKEIAPPQYLLEEITLKGGTSGGLLAIPVVFYLLTFIVSFILIIVSL